MCGHLIPCSSDAPSVSQDDWVAREVEKCGSVIKKTGAGAELLAVAPRVHLRMSHPITQGAQVFPEPKKWPFAWLPFSYNTSFWIMWKVSLHWAGLGWGGWECSNIFAHYVCEAGCVTCLWNALLDLLQRKMLRPSIAGWQERGHWAYICFSSSFCVLYFIICFSCALFLPLKRTFIFVKGLPSTLSKYQVDKIPRNPCPQSDQYSSFGARPHGPVCVCVYTALLVAAAFRSLAALLS